MNDPIEQSNQDTKDKDRMFLYSGILSLSSFAAYNPIVGIIVMAYIWHLYFENATPKRTHWWSTMTCAHSVQAVCTIWAFANMVTFGLSYFK